MDTKNIIAIYSDSPLSGKTTVAGAIYDTGGYTMLSFAAPIKRMLVAFLDDMGVEGPLKYLYNPKHKEEIIPEVGVSARYLMQTVGTEWGRKMINYNIWLKSMEQRIQRALDRGFSVVVDDMRFRNEYDLLANMGAYMVKVARPGVTYAGKHASEGGLRNMPWDFTIFNDGTLEELEEKALRVVSVIDETNAKGTEATQKVFV